MTYYGPEAIVLQCGGDSLSGDRLGCFNLSMAGHANCVKYVKSFGVPVIVLGGGGYTMRNVARTWAYETGELVGQQMSKQLPFNDYYEYFAPDYELDVRPSNMENANSNDYLHKIKTTVIDNIRRTGRPSVEAFTNIPDNPLTRAEEDSDVEDDLDIDMNQDVRSTQRQQDRRIAHNGELYEDSEDEDYKNDLGVRAQPGTKKRRNITDHPNPNAVEPDGLDKLRGLDDLNGDSAVSTRQTSPAGSRTPAIAEQSVEDDGDVDMDDAEATTTAAAAAVDSTHSQSPANNLTPPESPSAAPAAAVPAPDVEMAGADEETKATIAEEKQKGEAERDSENVKGEVRTEVAKDS